MSKIAVDVTPLPPGGINHVGSYLTGIDMIAIQNGQAENARVIEQLKTEINRLNKQSGRDLLMAAMRKFPTCLHF